MNSTELKYTLLCLTLLALSLYSFYLSNIVGIPLAIIGIFFGIKSTDSKKPKWKYGILVTIVGIILGYILAAILLESITG